MHILCSQSHRVVAGYPRPSLETPLAYSGDVPPGDVSSNNLLGFGLQAASRNGTGSVLLDSVANKIACPSLWYEMHGWDATWVERVLGLTIFKYDMENVSKEPVEWRVGNNDEVNDGSVGGEHQLEIDGDADLSQLYLQQKRYQDIEELNAGLHIHHDEKLNEVAQSRSSSVNAAPHQGALIAASMTEEWEIVDGGWDFDETEDPDELMRKAQKARMEIARNSRGRGMLAGLDERKEGERRQPIWKKP